MADALKSANFLNNHLDSFIRKNSIIIDLKKDETTLFYAMKANKRKNIRTACRMGVNVRKGDRDDIGKFFRFMKATCKRQQVQPSPSNENFFIKLWDIFSKTDQMRLFISEYKGKDISGCIVLLLSDTAYLWKFGWSGDSGNCRPNDILYWLQKQ